MNSDTSVAAEERYRAFIENSAEGIWRFDLDEPVPASAGEDEQIEAFYRGGVLAEANDAFARMYGFERGEQLAGARLGDLLVRDIPTNEAYLRAFIRSGYRLSDAESVETGRDGKLRRFSNTLTGIVDREGRLVRAWGTQRDVTEQRRLEESLRRSEERLREAQAQLETALSAGEIATCSIDLVNERVTGDTTLARFFGVRPEDASGGSLRAFLDAIDEEDRARATRTVYETLASGTDEYADEYRVTTAAAGVGGTAVTRWLYARARVARDAAGKAVGLIGAVTDVTARHRAEQERAASEERFQALADNIAQLAWMADPSGSIFWYNRRWFEYTGTTLDQMRGWGWRTVHHPDHVEAVTRKFREHVERGEVWEDTFPLRGADGQYRWFLSRAIPTRDPSGRIVLWCGTNTDVTAEREAAQKQRRFLMEMLAGFTEGRLRLCFAPDELPAPLPPQSDEVALSAAALGVLRRRLDAVTQAIGLPEARAADLKTAAHEAAMNAVRHGGGGTGRVRGDAATGTAQVWIEDRGSGIAEDMIHRAVEPGFTTNGFGQGFFLMRSCADRVYLLTGPHGTTVVLEQWREPPLPAWLQAAAGTFGAP